MTRLPRSSDIDRLFKPRTMRARSRLPEAEVENRELGQIVDYNDGRIYAFADGAYKRGRGHAYGGWGVVLYWKGHEREASGSADNCTNNQMEFEAIRQAMLMLHEKEHHKQAVIVSDSQYCINTICVWAKAWVKNGWVTQNGTPVQNREQIEQVLALKQPWMCFRWVKGHSGHVFNERVDRLAVAARKELEDRFVLLDAQAAKAGPLKGRKRVIDV